MAPPLALVLLVAGIATTNAAGFKITTLAGTDDYGFSGDGGVATLATLSYPQDAVGLPDGSYLIADSQNQRIRQVSRDGTITTVAGTGIEGSLGDGGPASQARLSWPRGLAVLPDGSFLIADRLNNKVRKVSATDGTITTVAGTGAVGSSGDGGLATLATLNQPYRVSATPDLGFLISEEFSCRIRKVWADGTITTLVVLGVGDSCNMTASTGMWPNGVLALPDGGALVSLTAIDKVVRVSASGVVSDYAGTGVRSFSGDGGPAQAAGLNYPGDLADLGGGSIAIEDGGNHRIRVVDGNGNISTLAGSGSSVFSGDGGPALDAGLGYLGGIGVAPNGLLITNGTRVRVVSGLAVTADGPAYTTSTSRTISFGSLNSGVEFECRNDGGPWEACTSPQVLTDLADGTHAFDVRPIGSTTATASETWVVDTTPPPAAAISLPADGEILASGTIQVGWGPVADATSGIDHYDVSVDGNMALTFSDGACSATECLADVPAHLPNGPHSVVVRAVDRAGNGSTSEPRAFTIQEVGVSINAAAQFTRTAAVTLSLVWPSGATSVVISNDGGFAGAVTSPVAPSVAWTLSSAGAERLPKTVYVRFKGGSAGAETYTDDIILDLTVPAVATPASRTTSGTGSAPLRVSWSGSDTTSGIREYQLQRRVNSGTWTSVPLTSANATSYVAVVRPAVYQFRTRAVDKAGNWSQWKTGAAFRMKLTQDSSAAVTWAGTWRRMTSTSASGGTLRYAKSSTARARYRFYGRSVSWVTATGPTRGSASIYVDGSYVKTISLYAPTTTYRRVVYKRTWSSLGWHRIEIRCRATAGHPRVDVDAFAVLTAP